MAAPDLAVGAAVAVPAATVELVAEAGRVALGLVLEDREFHLVEVADARELIDEPLERAGGAESQLELEADAEVADLVEQALRDRELLGRAREVLRDQAQLHGHGSGGPSTGSASQTSKVARAPTNDAISGVMAWPAAL